MPDGLKIVVGGDVTQANQALVSLGKTIDLTEVKIESFDLTISSLAQRVGVFGGGVNRFTTSFTRLPPVVDKAKTSLDRLSKSSSSATQASINLGRVIQDAPFGFLGIANNLNPLLESFQRLRAESGSSAVALKSLGKSLMGAGGLGLALSIASTLLIVFGDKLFGMGNAAKKAKEENDRLKQTLEELSGTIAERSSIAAAGAADELATVNALTNSVLNQTLSYKERNNALNQLKDINKGYFGDLTLETASIATLTGRVNEYTNALIAAETVKAFAGDIGKLNVEFSKQLIQLNKIGNQLDEYKRKLAVTSQTYTSLTGEERVGSAEYVNLQKAISKTTNEYNKQLKVLDELKQKGFDFKGGLQQAINDSLKFKPLKDVKVDEVNIKPDKLKVKPKKTEIDVSDFNFVQSLANTGKLPEVKVKVLLDVGQGSSSQGTGAGDEVKKEAKKLGEDVAEDFNQAFTDAFQSAGIGLGEILGNALSGEAMNIGQTIGGIFSALLSQIGKSLIAYGAIKLGLDKILASGGIVLPGAVAIALGVAAIAAAQLAKNAGKPVRGFAAGGLVSGPQLALIGEGSGTSRSNPEVVAPLDKLRSMLSGLSGGGKQLVYVTGRLRGNDMILQNSRTQRSQRRTTGR